MNAIIISNKSKTARALAQELGIVSNPNVLTAENQNVIRWGTTRTLSISGKELNKAEAVKLASNKAKARQVLLEAGLPVPTPTETMFPVIGRTERHSQGSGFFICHNEADVERAKARGAVYFSQFYPKQNEYRVHVAGNRAILMSIKEGDKNQYIWNKRKSGFTFRHLRRSVWLEDEHLRNMVRSAKKAVKALGLDFGAVDIMADADGSYAPFVISEVNTSPALSPLAVQKYAKYFREELAI